MAIVSNFMLFDHKVESKDKTLGDLHAALAFDPASKDPTLQDAINGAIAKDPAMRRTPFAVLDVTRLKENKLSRYAGNLDTEMHDPGSMGKLQFMLGAYQLQFDLACLAAESSDITVNSALFSKAAAGWQTRLSGVDASKSVVLRSDKPKIERVDDVDVLFDGQHVPMGAFAQVSFENIFDKAGSPPAKFVDMQLPFPTIWLLDEDHWNQRPKVQKIAPGLVPTQFDVRGISFMDRMRLMIGFSSNLAARSIVRDLGMAYVHSPSWAAHLFEPDKAGGLWIGEDYLQPDGNVWRAPPFGAQPKQRNRAASPLALVTLMAAIFQEKVMDSASCAAMQKLLYKTSMAGTGNPADETTGVVADPDKWKNIDTPGIGTRSYIEDALTTLEASDPTSFQVASKLGIGQLAKPFLGPNRYSDTAYVKRKKTRDGTGIEAEYALAILDVPDADFAAIPAIVKVVDRAVLDANPL